MLDVVTIGAGRVRAEILATGATLRQVWVDGAPCCLAFDDPASYARPATNPYLGSVVGRYANRIGGAAFTLDGTRHTLVANEGPNQLHGGPDGFAHRAWTVVDHTPDATTLRLRSPDGDQGFPGAVDVTATYRAGDDAIEVILQAAADAPTIVNLTNHTYWNLAGGGPVADHVLTVPAHRLVAVDDESIPTGGWFDVADTGFDLRSPTRLGDAIDATGGIDHSYDVAGADGPVAVLMHPPTGRRLTVTSDRPGVQVYTANALGPPFLRHGAVCLEPQFHPDTPNRPAFGSAVLRPGELDEHRIHFAFA